MVVIDIPSAILLLSVYKNYNDASKILSVPPSPTCMFGPVPRSPPRLRPICLHACPPTRPRQPPWLFPNTLIHRNPFKPLPSPDDFPQFVLHLSKPLPGPVPDPGLPLPLPPPSPYAEYPHSPEVETLLKLLHPALLLDILLVLTTLGLLFNEHGSSGIGVSGRILCSFLKMDTDLGGGLGRTQMLAVGVACACPWECPCPWSWGCISGLEIARASVGRRGRGLCFLAAATCGMLIAHVGVLGLRFKIVAGVLVLMTRSFR